jgi:asparagine synthase (glutamine-hydrolysing)
MFAGLISNSQAPAAWGDPSAIMTALAPYSPSAPRDAWQTDAMCLMQVNTRTGSGTAAIYRHPESGLAILFWGRLDNRSELIGHLHLPPVASDEALIAQAWLQWGEQCPERLVGDFAFAIANPGTGSLFLARDVMGVKPLYYRQDDNGVFFASSASAFLPLRLGQLTRCERWMAAYLIDMSRSHTDTAYLEVKKLQGAHSLLIEPDGRTSLRRYHRFIDDAPIERQRNLHWLEAYRAVWQESVACRLPAQGDVASENSGGLDSGSITAELARQLGTGIGRLHGMGFCYESEEPAHIMATAMQWGIPRTTLFSARGNPDWLASIERATRVTGYPQEHINGASHTPFYELCQREELGVLFSGFGGDEAVTYPGGYPARLECVDRGQWGHLWRTLGGPLPMQIGRMAKTLILAAQPTPKHHPGILSAYRERWPQQFLRQEIVDKYDLQTQYFDAATYDEKFRQINAAVCYLIERSYAPVRLESCTLMAASYGIDYVWPLWDQRLVQQWLSTPSVWKVGDGGISRYLHRRAAADASSEMVVWKRSKDMGMAGTVKSAGAHDNSIMLRQLLERVEDLPGPLMEIVDVPRLKAEVSTALREQRKGADYSFTLDRNLAALETLNSWFRAKY